MLQSAIRKNVQKEYDEKLAGINETLTTAKEANWLYEKFGEGIYAIFLVYAKLQTGQKLKKKAIPLRPALMLALPRQKMTAWILSSA